MKKPLLILACILLLFSCSEDILDDTTDNTNTLPSSTSIDIPSSISTSSSGTSSRIVADTMGGSDIYEGIRASIGIAEESAEVVESVIQSLVTYNINQAMEVVFTSDEDGREKKLVVVENPTYDGVSFELGLTITDQENKALQAFWDQDDMITIILDIDELNHNHADIGEGLYKVVYKSGTESYEDQMEITLANFPVNPDNPAAWDHIKVFAGINGDIIDVYGNINYPNLGSIYNYTGGASYSFTAKAEDDQNIAVVELAIAPSETTSISTIMTDYPVDNVLEALLISIYGDIPQIDPYIANADAYGYFNNQGFIGAGQLPSTGDYTAINDLSSLSPYTPSEVSTQAISWGE